MDAPVVKPEMSRGASARPTMQSRLFRKYALMFVTVVCSALALNGVLDIWASYREQESLLARIQHEQAEAAAASISQFVKEIKDQMAWSVMFTWDGSTYDEWRLDAVRMLREVPAVTEVAQLDGSGHELYRLSRQSIDVVGSHEDHSQDLFLRQAVAHRVYYGPVYFVDGSEPYMTLAIAGSRPEDGVIEAQVDIEIHLGCRVANPGRAPRLRLRHRRRRTAHCASRYKFRAAQHRYVAFASGAQSGRGEGGHRH